MGADYHHRKHQGELGGRGRAPLFVSYRVVGRPKGPAAHPYLCANVVLRDAPLPPYQISRNYRLRNLFGKDFRQPASLRKNPTEDSFVARVEQDQYGESSFGIRASRFQVFRQNLAPPRLARSLPIWCRAMRMQIMPSVSSRRSVCRVRSPNTTRNWKQSKASNRLGRANPIPKGLAKPTRSRLAAELLAATDEQELEQFLGDLFAMSAARIGTVVRRRSGRRSAASSKV